MFLQSAFQFGFLPSKPCLFPLKSSLEFDLNRVKPKFISFPVKFFADRSKFQFCTAARSIIIFTRTLLPCLCVLSPPPRVIPLVGGRGLTTDDIGSKRTNHKFGCVGEVCQTNILIHQRFLLFENVYFLILVLFLFPKSGEPLPLRRP